MVFSEHPIQTYLDELASSAPVPGGGSVAALTGALAAGLVSMVCQLTVGRRRFRSVEAELRDVLSQSEQDRFRLTELVQRDTEVYAEVMAAYRLPAGTEAETTARAVAWQGAIAAAIAVPLEIVECCQRIAQLALVAARLGNPWAVSDAGAAASLAEAAARAAAMSVEVNARAVDDAAAREGYRAPVADMLERITAVSAEAQTITYERMGGA